MLARAACRDLNVEVELFRLAVPEPGQSPDNVLVSSTNGCLPLACAGLDTHALAMTDDGCNDLSGDPKHCSNVSAIASQRHSWGLDFATMLEPLGSNLWIADDGIVSFKGFDYPTACP